MKETFRLRSGWAVLIASLILVGFALGAAYVAYALIQDDPIEISLRPANDKGSADVDAEIQFQSNADYEVAISFRHTVAPEFAGELPEESRIYNVAESEPNGSVVLRVQRTSSQLGKALEIFQPISNGDSYGMVTAWIVDRDDLSETVTENVSSLSVLTPGAGAWYKIERRNVAGKTVEAIEFKFIVR